MPDPHLIYYATPHGFGHAAVLTAIMAAVQRQHPTWRQTLVTTVPEPILRERLPGPHQVCPEACPTDIGLLMAGATTVRGPETQQAYQQAHAGLDRHIARRVMTLRALAAQTPGPVVVISCVSYTAIAAARQVGIPALAVGPFLWSDILRAYPHDPGVLAEMEACYSQADAIILTTPHVPCHLHHFNQHTVGPVGLGGQNRVKALIAAGFCQRGDRLAFVSLGGMAERIDTAGWHCPPGWRLLDPLADSGRHARQAGLTVSDMIASASAVLTKPGYGTFVEAAMVGASLFYRERADWPETAGLADWYAAVAGPVRALSAKAFQGSGPMGLVAAVTADHMAETTAFDGAQACMRLIAGYC